MWDCPQMMQTVILTCCLVCVYVALWRGVCLDSLLYYKCVFIASISDAVSQHPISPGLCAHTDTDKAQIESVGAEWGFSPNHMDHSV